MPAASPSEDKQLACLDRPQHLGILPTWAFWGRRDVKKLAAPLTITFGALWFMMIDLVAPGIPRWANVALGVSGYYLIVGMLERYIRIRMRMRRLAIEQSLESGNSLTP